MTLNVNPLRVTALLLLGLRTRSLSILVILTPSEAEAGSAAVFVCGHRRIFAQVARDRGTEHLLEAGHIRTIGLMGTAAVSESDDQGVQRRSIWRRASLPVESTEVRREGAGAGVGDRGADQLINFSTDLAAPLRPGVAAADLCRMQSRERNTKARLFALTLISVSIGTPLANFILLRVHHGLVQALLSSYFYACGLGASSLVPSRLPRTRVHPYSLQSRISSSGARSRRVEVSTIRKILCDHAGFAAMIPG
jgi:hypothetical protein